MTILKLDQANKIIDAALAEGRKRQFAPLAVAVLDAGGHLIAFQREDGAGFARFDIAYGKAWGALGMGFGTRELLQRDPTFITAIAAATQGRIIPSPGGVLILDANNDVVGGLVSQVISVIMMKSVPLLASKPQDFQHSRVPQKANERERITGSLLFRVLLPNTASLRTSLLRHGFAVRRARGRLDAHRQNGFFVTLGFTRFDGESTFPPAARQLTHTFGRLLV